jgi:diguanylate cyclase (GGDEF)-like protein
MNFHEKKLKLLLNYIEELTERYEDTIRQKKQLLKELEIRALYDPLTGLLNRHALLEFLQKEIEKVKRKKKETLYVVFLDLDNFKSVNDIYGHREGDRVLKEVADLLKKHFRKYDFVSRFGGDEFVVVLRDIPKEEMEKILLELQRRIEEIFRKFKISVSYGIAEISEGENDIDKLISLADKRMYEMKKQKKIQPA